MKKRGENKGVQNIIITILIVNWITWLVNYTDAYVVPYIVVAFVGIWAYFTNNKNELIMNAKIKWLFHGVSLGFSSIILLANYKAIVKMEEWKISVVLLLLVAGFILANEILVVTFNRLYNSGQNSGVEKVCMRIFSVKIFLGAMISITTIDLLIFSGYYPGVLSPDSITQLKQIVNGIYSNHHPFWHTMIIKNIMSVGMFFFDNINYAVALYSIFQIISMAAIFAFMITTLYQKYNNRKIYIIAWIWFAVYPVHIMYSFTMWKDVLFGGMVALLLTALFRILYQIGGGKNQWCNYSLLCVGMIGMGLLRSNGLFALVITFFVFLIMFGKKYKKIMIFFVASILFCSVLKGPVLKVLDVSSPDLIESLSIPAQQISRVFYEKGEISDEEINLVNNVVDVFKISEIYYAHCSDPIKNLVREKNNQEYLVENKDDFIKLYLSIGIKNPKLYLTAYIDQTKGYWNGGYEYWYWEVGVVDNTLGIYQEPNDGIIKNIWSKYLQMYEENKISVFIISLCIGFFVWLISYQFVIMLALNRKIEALFAVPVIIIILSLVIATPVYSEFRYAYAIFTCIPIILSTLIGYKDK